LFSFSEGRTFRVALQLQRRADPQQERLLGLLAHCHGCGEQFSQSLWQLRQWPACACGAAAPPLAISGPLWLGPLQHGPTLEAMADVGASASPQEVAPASVRLLRRLLADPGVPERCWPLAELGRRLGGGPPPSDALLAALRAEGFTALRSGVMEGCFRCNAPWSRVLELAAALNR
jgi:tRNA (guanine26-N2/guanine27-N2)-dimethyltransferase